VQKSVAFIVQSHSPGCINSLKFVIRPSAHEQRVIINVEKRFSKSLPPMKAPGSAELLANPPILFRVVCWAFPGLWGLTGISLRHSHLFATPAQFLCCFIISLFLIPVIVFLSSSWFRRHSVWIIGFWVCWFVGFSFTQGNMQWFYDYIFRNMLNPWAACKF